jgi:hypothetical protein
MDAKPPPSIRIKRYLKQLAVRILIYLTAYVLIASLTIGPMFWYWFDAVYVGGPVWIAKFYAPLLWLCEHLGWLGYLVNSYINWWIL